MISSVHTRLNQILSPLISQELPLNKSLLVITTFGDADAAYSQTIDLLGEVSELSVLIVDDGSHCVPCPPSSADQNRLFVWSFLDNNGGPAWSRNFGLDFARDNQYDLVHFLDPDDFVFPEKFSRVSALFQSNPTCDALVSSTIKTNQGRRVTSEFKSWFVHLSNRKIERDDLRYFNPFSLSSLVCKATLNARFPEDEKFIAVEDYYFYCELVSSGYTLRYLDEPLVQVDVRPESLSSNKIEMAIKFFMVNREFYRLAIIKNIILYTLVHILNKAFRKCS